MDREREKERERRQREKERLRRQDEERRRRREQHDGENTSRKREVEIRKEKALEKRRNENSADSPHSEKMEKPARESKKEESSKRERVRNKVWTPSFQISTFPYTCVKRFLRCLFLRFRTDLPSSCTSQGPGAATVPQEEEEVPNPALPTGKPMQITRKRLTEGMTERISDFCFCLWHFKLKTRPSKAQRSGPQPHAALIQQGLHPALPVPVEEGVLSLSEPD